MIASGFDILPPKYKVQDLQVHDGGVWALCSIGGGRIVSGGKDRSLIEWNVVDLVRVHGPTLVCVSPLICY